ncbi:hypothetical protein [Nostoc flagelliforme]|uniref:hypothetical protein n=1 Tax=Nostoc flagelliforme TaxID=1306274 RepID=UPI003BAE4BEA
MAESAKANFKTLSTKLQQNAIYDDLITRVFKNLLHKADVIHIAIARRGKAAREEALEQAINQAQKNFESNGKLVQIVRLSLSLLIHLRLLVYKSSTITCGLYSDAMNATMTSFFCPLPRNIDSLWTWTIIVTNLMESGMAIAIY